MINRLKQLQKPIICLLLAIFTGWIILLLAGYDAIAAFSALYSASFGSVKVFTVMLNKSTPILFCALAYAIAQRGNLMNIGCDGQLCAGAILSSVVAIYLGNLPSIILIPLTMLAGIIGGMIWAFVPVYLKVKNGVSEVITTIMFNYIAAYLVAYLISGPMKDLNSTQNISWTISSNAMLTVLFTNTKLHAGFIIAAILAILLYFFLFKTTYGYEIRAVGYNRTAARTAGISDKKTMISTMLLSGAIAGLGGAIEIMGTTYYLIGTVTDSYGFTAIAVSMLASNNPIAIIFSSMLFGFLRNGSSAMQRLADISSSYVDVFEGILIIFIAIAFAKTTKVIKAKKAKNKEVR